MFNSWQVTAPPHEAPESNIITRMMASPESLLVLSLIKGNIAQAADVIKVWISKRFFFFFAVSCQGQSFLHFLHH